MADVRKEKIVLVGAGSAMFTRGLIADLLQRGWDLDLALVDPDPGALEVAERLASKMISARKANISLSAFTDRRDALPGATAIICTVGVGGRRAWEKDVFIPRKYGLYYPVGDTVGPGGTSRAMRMIPAMVGIAEDFLDLSPDALFFNYSNPMAPNCRAIRKATGAPVIGLCHGVFHVGHFLASVLGVSESELRYSAMGINHLTWFTEIRANGADLMPKLMEIAEERIAANADDPFSWRMLRIFGAFPAVLDRHVTEFFPQFFAQGKHYGKILGKDSFSFEGTIAGGDRIYEEMKEAAFSPDPLGEDFFEKIGGEHEQVIDILLDIRRESGAIYSVNLPNAGQVPNLPADAIVESPAAAVGGELRPIHQKPLSPGLAGTLATRFMWVETTVDAALEGERAKFIQALTLDGGVPSLEVAETLADEFIEAHAEYLPKFA